MEIGNDYRMGMLAMRPGATGIAVPSASVSAFAFAEEAASSVAEMVFGAPAAETSDSLARDKAYAKMMQDRFNQECQTCKNRRYQDGSNDASVSFQTPQHIDPAVSASVVMSHEKEHVVNEQANAEQSGGKVVSQHVMLHGGVCPECGQYYIAGGTTTTVTKHGGDDGQENGAAALHGHANEGDELNVSV